MSYLAEMKMIKLAMLCLGCGGLLVFPSCNTVKGFGEDLQGLGKKMERKAERGARDY